MAHTLGPVAQIGKVARGIRTRDRLQPSDGMGRVRPTGREPNKCDKDASIREWAQRFGFRTWGERVGLFES